ncbi:MAG: hypothetical protein ACR2QF_00645, partial [Geminicoccaceae bacterium]
HNAFLFISWPKKRIISIEILINGFVIKSLDVCISSSGEAIVLTQHASLASAPGIESRVFGLGERQALLSERLKSASRG